MNIFTRNDHVEVAEERSPSMAFMAEEEEGPLLQLPDHLLVDIIACMAEDSLSSLAYTKCCGQKLKIGEQGPVYRRAVLQAKHIESLWDPTTLLTRAEHEFIKKCEAAKTPFQDYAKAAHHLLFIGDIQGALEHLKKANGSRSVEGPSAYLNFLCLIFSGDDTDLSIGVELLKTLKANNFFSRELRRCRGHIRRFLSNHRWRDLHLSWANQGRPSLCPNRESHQRRRIKDEWLHEEETDECLACDVDSEAEFVFFLYHK